MILGDKGELYDLTERFWDLGPPPTARTVLGWFKEAWPKKDRYPDLNSCVYVSQSVRTIRNVEQGRKTRKRNRDEEKAVTAVKNGAGSFIKHAPSVVMQLEATIERLTMQVSGVEDQSILIIDLEAHQMACETRDKVERAQEALGAALEALKTWSKRGDEVDRLVWVQHHMQEAWARTDGTRPSSTDDHGPVVLFIHSALASVPDCRKTDAIGRALRRLRRSASKRQTGQLN